MTDQPPSSVGLQTGPQAGPTAIPRAAPPAEHILSFDVEEYYQVEAAAARVRPEDWQDYPSRVESSVDKALGLLDEAGQTATFFVLGAVARDHGPMVHRIAEAGHEIASHGMSHRMLTRMTREELALELRESRKLLEDLAGARVAGFRAPTFSITRQTGPWAIDTLVEAGYEYDSSVFPVRHDRYGIPDAPRWAHWAVGADGGRILEVPPLTRRMLGMNLPVGGGGYLRLFPTGLIGGALDAARCGGHVGVIYLHPWELDPGQPVLPMSRMSRWRHRVNLHKTADKLRALMRRRRFGRFAAMLDTLRLTARSEFAMAKSQV